MFVFVMAPQDCRHGSHEKSRSEPFGTRRLISCHSQKSIRHNDLDADEPRGD
jgi:hypothetical protein